MNSNWGFPAFATACCFICSVSKDDHFHNQSRPKICCCGVVMADLTGTQSVNVTINYLKTRKGMTMAGEILLCIFSIVGKTVPVNVGCYIIVPITELVLGTIMLMLFTRGMEKTSFEVHWLFCDLIRGVTGSVLLLITSIQCAVLLVASSVLSLIMGEVFAFCAGCLLGYDAFLIYSTIKNKSISLTDNYPSNQNPSGQDEQASS